MLSLREDKLLTQISFIIEEYLSFLFFSCVNFDSFLLFWENQKYTINWHSQKSNSEVWGIVKKKLKYIKNPLNQLRKSKVQNVPMVKDDQHVSIPPKITDNQSCQKPLISKEPMKQPWHW